MAFLLEINNKRDAIFSMIKIIRVIIPLRTILHGYPPPPPTPHGHSDSKEFSRGQRLYWGQTPFRGGAFPPTPPFSNITFLNYPNLTHPISPYIFFTYKIAPIWNRLPAEAVNSASVEQFKIELDKVIDTLI